jgi:hypothetical protein
VFVISYCVRLFVITVKILFFVVIAALLFGLMVWLLHYSCSGWGREINWLLAIIAAVIVGLLGTKYANRIPVLVCLVGIVLICVTVAVSLSTTAGRSQSVNGLVYGDITVIRSYAEIFYNQNQQFSYEGVCKDDRVQSLLESASQHKLRKQIGGCQGLIWVWLASHTVTPPPDRTVTTNCRATADAYKVYSELPELYGPDYQQRYFCVDSTGFAQYVNTVSAEAFSCETPHLPAPADKVGGINIGDMTCKEDGVEIDCDTYFQN